MRRAICITLVLLGIALAGFSGWASWWLLLDGRAPAGRPDLVVLPEGTPPPPAGYPTENALKVAYVLGQIELLELHDRVVPPAVEVRKDIEYGRVGDRALKVDVYSPKNLDKPLPGLIFIHGGGWKSGDRSDYQLYTIAFAQKGYVAATIGYRLAKEALFPAAVEDAKCAVRWMRANAAELHVDPDRIAVIGGSAGGHLSLMVGYTAGDTRLEGSGGHEDVSSAVQAVVDLYGPTDLDRPIAHDNPTVTGFLGKHFKEDPQLFRFASPINHLDAKDPPTFVLQGTIDSIVPVEQSDILVEKLKQLGVPYWYDRIDGWPHTMDVARPINERTQMLISRFLETYLKGPNPAEPPKPESAR